MSQAKADAEAWGIPADLIDTLDTAETDFLTWPDNMPIVAAFLAVQTQWRAVPLGTSGVHWQGLDYAAVVPGLKMAGIRLTPPQWAWLRVMEGAAASALNGVKG